MKEAPRFEVRNFCPVCGSTRIVLLFSRALTDPVLFDELKNHFGNSIRKDDFEGIRYEVVRCENCSLLYQKTVPTVEFSSNFYIQEQLPASWEKKRRDALAQYAERARSAERISLLLNKPSHAIRVLELGAGWGLWSQMAAAYGYEVHAVDTSRTRMERAAKVGIPTHAGLSECANESFDFAYCADVIEHVNEPLPLLKEFASKLKPGGLCFLGVPDATDAPKTLANPAGELVKSLYPLGHINGFTHAALVRLANEADLELIHGSTLARVLLSKVRSGRNLGYFQEALKLFRNQRSSTGLYFRKPTRADSVNS